MAGDELEVTCVSPGNITAGDWHFSPWNVELIEPASPPPARKFAVGDRVRCVAAEDRPALVEGATYTISEVPAPGFVRLEGIEYLHLASARFEPAPVDAFERHAEPDEEYEECPCADCMAQDEPAPDAVFRPQHYARFVIEPLTFINANKLPANIANVVKYVCRFDAKNGREDLHKARRYIDIQLECMNRDDRVAAGEDANVVWSRVL